jgi:hypothetical protein
MSRLRKSIKEKPHTSRRESFKKDLGLPQVAKNVYSGKD